MSSEKVKINRFTCRFSDNTLEKEYLTYSWKRTWKNIKILLSVNVPVSLIIMADDIFVQGVGLNKYYLSYHLVAVILLFLFIFSSNDSKRKYHQAYFLVTAIGFMNCGAWTYYFSDVTFPVGGGVLPILLMLYLIVYPFHFVNALITMTSHDS